MATKLTDLKIKAIKPDPTRRLEIPDAGKPGLFLVVHPSGAKAWAVRYRRLSDRKPRKYTLDGFPSLAVAHRLAQEVLDAVADGKDPAADKIAERQRACNADPAEVEALIADFMHKHVRTPKGRQIRLSTRIETGRLLGFKPDPENDGAWILSGNGVAKHWKRRMVAEIRKADILNLVEAIAEVAPVKANRTLAALKSFFAWCTSRDILEKSPAAGVADPAAETARNRPLSDAELAAIWKVADAIGYPYGRMVQLIILTGCRNREVRAATWSEFDLEGRVWLLNGDRTKNGEDHLVPLAAPAMDLLKGLPRIAGKTGLLFTTTGSTPISGLSKCKRRLDLAVLAELKKNDPNAILPPWRLHDLRHTLKTWMQQSRIPKDVRNAVQNHHDRDMDELYGHYTFEAEKRAALEAWADHILHLGDTHKGADVVPLARGRL